ncbi:MAG TPA: hypothetical protein VKO87_06675, partial [Gemmatimonadaceae bacterium]|nr:hypothetical protein [Gemmatimonadaceae bacterium]
MKKSLLALFLLAACAPKATTTTTTASPVGAAPEPARSSNVTGGSSPRSAVDAFLTAVKAQDLQGMSVIFGTNRGPARDN